MRLARTRELACMADPYGLEPCPELGASVGWLRGVWWFWVWRGLCPVGRPCLFLGGAGVYQAHSSKRWKGNWVPSGSFPGSAGMGDILMTRLVNRARDMARVAE